MVQQNQDTQKSNNGEDKKKTIKLLINYEQNDYLFILNKILEPFNDV
jgi:hypothetical protein